MIDDSSRSLAWTEVFKRATQETHHEKLRQLVRDAEVAIAIRQVELGNSAAEREERQGSLSRLFDLLELAYYAAAQTGRRCRAAVTASCGRNPSRPRAEPVSARTALVNAARGLEKSYGERLPECGTQQASRELGAGLSTELHEVLQPLFIEIESLNERVKDRDQPMEKIAKEVYPEVSLLKQVKGVGTQIALTYALAIEDP